jgi:hypothetical protein
MTDDLSVQSLWRSAFPPATTQMPSRDLWPLVVDRISAPVRLSWLDISVAAGVAIALFRFPEWLLLLAFHL